MQDNSSKVIFHLLDCAVLFVERQFRDLGKDASESRKENSVLQALR